MRELYFEFVDKNFYFDESDKDKYIVFTCAKNENDYIIEWVEHYLNLDFDKIIIMDNNEIGDDSLSVILSDYIDKQKVQILDFRGHEAAQVRGFCQYCRYCNFKWCAFFDCDEFLELSNYTNIKTFLSTIDCDCLCLNWLMYGPNGQFHKNDANIQERFPLPQFPLLYFRENCFMKSIVRGNEKLFKKCKFNGSHLPYLNEGDGIIHYSLGGYVDMYKSSISHCCYPFHYKKAYIKHYYTKSFDEWIDKASRGWPDGTPTLKTSNYFAFNENIDIPISYLENGLFDGKESDSECEALEYNYILIEQQIDFVYPFIGNIIKMMSKSQNKVFAIINSKVEDSVYNILLEFAFKTNNKIAFCDNIAEFWGIFKEPYEKYYKITFF